MPDSIYGGLTPPELPLGPLATLPGVAVANGVRLTPPPATILSTVTKQIEDAFAALPAGTQGGLAAIGTWRNGEIHTNLALVQRIGGRAAVTTWIGKTWGTPLADTEAGVAFKWTWGGSAGAGGRR